MCFERAMRRRREMTDNTARSQTHALGAKARSTGRGEARGSVETKLRDRRLKAGGCKVADVRMSEATSEAGARRKVVVRVLIARHVPRNYFHVASALYARRVSVVEA